jgi:hypothetical protein
MCYLPNLTKEDLTHLSRNRKVQAKKTNAKTVELIVPESIALHCQHKVTFREGK